MTNLEKHRHFAKLSKQIKNYCVLTLGMSRDEDIEDLVHDVLLYRLSNPKRERQMISQSVIDCIRKKTGRKGDKNNEIRKALSTGVEYKDQIKNSESSF